MAEPVVQKIDLSGDPLQIKGNLPDTSPAMQERGSRFGDKFSKTGALDELLKALGFGGGSVQASPAQDQQTGGKVFGYIEEDPEMKRRRNQLNATRFSYEGASDQSKKLPRIVEDLDRVTSKEQENPAQIPLLAAQNPEPEAANRLLEQEREEQRLRRKALIESAGKTDLASNAKRAAFSDSQSESEEATREMIQEAAKKAGVDDVTPQVIERVSRFAQDEDEVKRVAEGIAKDQKSGDDWKWKWSDVEKIGAALLPAITALAGYGLAGREGAMIGGAAGFEGFTAYGKAKAATEKTKAESPKKYQEIVDVSWTDADGVEQEGKGLYDYRTETFKYIKDQGGNPVKGITLTKARFEGGQDREQIQQRGEIQKEIKEMENRMKKDQMDYKAKLDKATKDKTIPATTATQLADLETASGEIQDLWSDWVTKASQRGSGLKQYLPWTSQAEYKDAQRTAAQSIGQKLEGGKLTDADFGKYMDLIPTPADTVQRARSKIERLSKKMMDKRANIIKSFSTAGYDVSGFQIKPGQPGQPAKKPTVAQPPAKEGPKSTAASKVGDKKYIKGKLKVGASKTQGNQVWKVTGYDEGKNISTFERVK